MTTKLSAQDLRQFTGTEHWYRHSLARNVLYTDGSKYLADQAGAYWLIDTIALLQNHEATVKGEPFQAWTLTVEADQTATLVCTDGNRRTLYRESIPFTDFPLPRIEIWVEDRTILLPSEH